MPDYTGKPYDQAFKYLAEQDAESLLFLLGALPEDIISIEVLPTNSAFRQSFPISFTSSRRPTENTSFISKPRPIGMTRCRNECRSMACSRG